MHRPDRSGPTEVEVDLGLGVRALFTTAAAGNLARHAGADPDSAPQRRRLLGERVGAPVVFGRQVHGSVAAWVGASPPGRPDLHDLRGADDAAATGVDALVATTSTLAVGVLVADCVPVLLADPRAGVVAAAHAGRVGLLRGVLTAVLAEMKRQGAAAAHTRAVLGPCAGACCYEVPEEMAREAAAAIPALSARTTWGTPSLDLRAGCRAVLAGSGLARVDEIDGCTIENETWFSYRRAAGRSTGRFAGVVRLLP